MTFTVENPERIGVAFLGVGRMGMSHLQTLAGIRNARVVVVADPDIEAARRGQQVSFADRATTDALDAINDPAVEAVVIVTPTSTHAELIEAAPQAGKAVLREKPIALSPPRTGRGVPVLREAGVPPPTRVLRPVGPG